MPDSSHFRESPPVTQDSLPDAQHPERRRVGSLAMWLMYRLVISAWTLAAIWILVLPADRITPRKTHACELLLFFGAVLVNLFSHSIAYGVADNAGMHFRQYFHRRFLPWSEFSKVQWKGYVMLRLRHPTLLLRSLHLVRYIPNPWGALRELPDDVRWMEQKIVEAQGNG